MSTLLDQAARHAGTEFKQDKDSNDGEWQQGSAEQNRKAQKQTQKSRARLQNVKTETINRGSIRGVFMATWVSGEITIKCGVGRYWLDDLAFQAVKS